MEAPGRLSLVIHRSGIPDLIKCFPGMDLFKTVTFCTKFFDTLLITNTVFSFVCLVNFQILAVIKI